MGIKDFYNRDEYIEETEPVSEDISIGKDPSSVNTDYAGIWNDNPYNTTPGNTVYDEVDDFVPETLPTSYIEVEVVKDTIITDYDTATFQDLAEDGATFFAIMKDGTEVQVDWTEIRALPEAIREETIDLVADIMNAPEQYFWTDELGVHIAEEQRESWENSVEDNFSDYDATTKPHHNMLMNSQGFLFRKALYNLSVMTSASVAFYDGQGNTANNIRALFGAQMAQIGKATSDHVIIDAQGVTAYKGDGSLHELIGIVDGANLRNATITGSKIADSTIENSKIVDGTIENAKIKDGTITGSKIQGSTLTDIPYAEIDELKARDISASDIEAATGFVSSLSANSIAASTLVSNQATINDLNVNYAHITDGVIDNAHINVANVDDISANFAHITSGVIDNAKIGHADVNGLSANYATIANLNAASGRIDDLEADHVSTTDFNAETARIDILVANTADLDTIRANSAKVTNLTAAELEADHATVGALETNFAKADMANVNNAWITNGTIKDAAISDGMINSVSANKLTAGTIDASNITVTNLNADNITTGTINGQRIGTGSLSLDKLSEDVYTETEVNGIVQNLQTQIDGAIETWTGTTVPTLQNSPASSWDTNSIKDTHVGDVYFIVNSESNQNGYNYRFTKTGNGASATYSWQLIKDSDVTNALQRLSTAEGKITTFDSDISTLKTDTGTLTTKTTNLETRMSDAESSILDKVDTTTFNEVSDTVNSHTQTISQMSTTLGNKADSSTVTSVTQRVSKNEQDISGINTKIGTLETTVENKADSSTVSTISSNLNSLSQTVSGHTQTISSMQSTIENKADGSTVSDLTTQINNISDTVDGHTSSIQSINQTIETKADGSTVSDLQDDYATFKQTVEAFESTIGETYATKSEVGDIEERISTAETSINQNKESIALKANSSDVYTKTQTDGLISTEVTNRNSAIEQSASDITASVSETYATKTALSDGIDDAKDYTDSEITSAKAAIKVTTDGISTEVAKKVGTSEIISKINQSAETIKIEASRVEIDGTAIFTSISSDVDSAIIGKGYATTAQVDTAKNEAISAAASDATTKANAAEQNAKNAIPTDISELNNDTGFITSSSLPTKVSDLTNDSGFQTSTQVDTAITSKGYATTTQAQGYADTAESNAKTYAEDQASTVNSALESYKSTTNSTLTSLQNQVDGQIEAWYKTVDPTSSNEPASTWSTNELKARHEGDLYYNVNNGHSWRWMKSGSSYSWQQIPDGDAAAALAAAQNAQTLADSKRRIFASTPTVPYDIGDLWVDGSKIKYANTSKTESQTYSSSDWLVTATDDSATDALEESISNNLTATHRLYYRTNTANNSLTAPNTWIEEATGNVYNQWTTKVPPLASSTAEGQTKYLYLYTCEQRRLYDGTIQCTKVQLDENTTVIDGGRIITNSITATQIAAGSITANEIDATNLHVAAANIDGTLAATQINASELTIGMSQVTNLSSTLNSKANSSDIPTDISELNNDTGFITSSSLPTKVSDLTNDSGFTSNASVLISCESIDYGQNTASLKATLFIDGVATTTNVTYQWLKDGTAISGATSQTLAVTSAMGLNHVYSCAVTY